MPDDVLDFLREQFSRVNAKIDEVRADVAEIKERLGFIEGQYASISRRVDRIGGDVDLVKRRLDLVDH